MSINTKLQVSGMTCTSCVKSITNELEKIQGVSSVSVSLLTEEATIIHGDSVTNDELLEKIDDLGFDGLFISSVEMTKSNNNEYTNTTIVQISGMTCSSCSNSIMNSLMQLPGVLSADVSLLTEEATIVHDSSIDPNEFVETIDDIGFDASLLSSIASTSSTNSLWSSFYNDKNYISDERHRKIFKTELAISGMTCTSCVNSITNSLRKLNGVADVSVSLLTEKAIVIHDESLPIDLLTSTIEDIGFDTTVINVNEMNDVNNNNDIVDSDIMNVTLKIFGMTCSSCLNTIEQSLLNLGGILSCKISLSSEEAIITYDSNIIGIRDIIQCIMDCGFDALLTNKLDSTSQIDLLAKIKEIQYWRHNFFNLLKFGLPVLLLSHIYPMVVKKCHFDPDLFRIKNGLFIDILLQSILGTYIQFCLGKRFYINCYKALSHGTGNMDVLICISTSIVYFYSLFSIIYSIFIDVYPNVLFDTSTMLFTFVSLGKWVESKAKGNTSTSLSKLLSLTPSFCIIVENPELFNNEKMESLDSSLIEQKQIGIDLLQKNDIAVVLPGSKIPSDGECVFGVSEVDESLLTGESIPIKKTKGSKLIGGSVNLTSTLYMRIMKLGEQTQLQQIVKLVKEAQISRAPIQRFADLIASIFVPSILIFSLITLIFWLFYVKTVPTDSVPKMFIDPKDSTRIVYFKILQVAISVIVVACPCALGLAAPTAVMVGTGVGATNGILIKGGEVLEKASKIDCVIFDKTGTLTKGHMDITEFKFIGEYELNPNFMWSLLNAIESNSEHPIAKAIVKGCSRMLNENKTPSFELVSINTYAGLGISVSCIDTESKKEIDVKLGNSKFLNNCEISNADDFTKIKDEFSNRSNISSLAHILIGNVYAGYVELSDSLKPDAQSIVETLHSLGYSVGMVTGDSVETSRYVAELLRIPINNVLAESSPEQKLEYIKGLQSKGLNVAFVGDGINDAPALVQSDVGIAISTGTDIAMSAADIVLLSSTSLDENSELEEDENNSNSHIGLLGVYASLDISKSTFNTIKLNFLLAIIYNMIMLPIAMGLLIIPFNITMHPMFASAAMACSSTSVIINSLFLKRWSLRKLNNRINERQNAKFFDVNLGWDDGMADHRENINQFSLESFVVNGGISGSKISLWKKAYNLFVGLFTRQNRYSYLNGNGD